MERLDKTESALGIIWRLVQQAKPYWWNLSGVLLLSLLATPLTLLGPLPMKIIIDNVIGSHPLPEYLAPFFPASVVMSSYSLLVAAVGLKVGSALIGQARSQASGLLQAYTGPRMVRDFRSRIFRQVQRLSFSYHDERGTTDSTYRIQHDARCIQEIPLGILIPLITDLFPLVGVIAVTTYLDWRLTLIALSTAPIMAGLVRFFGVRMRRKWKDVSALDSKSLSVVQETLSALRVVKAFGAERNEEQRFISRSDKHLEKNMDASFMRAKFRTLMSLTFTSASAVVLFVGSLHVLEGILTLGELTMVMSYVGQIFGPIRVMTRNATGLARSLASAERVFDVLDRKPDVDERPNARKIVRAQGRVAFENVVFSYRPGEIALSDVSFEVEPGATVGIQGRTGAGKSTLVSLMMRFHDPDSGRILLDGGGLRDYGLEDLRNQFAMVLQEPVLFSTTLRENIAYSRPGADEEEVMQAATLANAHDFISRLPDGYETSVGERGMTLSGGERQRISLARAFLKNAPILILDEPTSSVDTTTEGDIIDALQRLMHGRTTFMIAHRLNTLYGCNHRLELSHGTLKRFSAEKQPADVVDSLAGASAE